AMRFTNRKGQVRVGLIGTGIGTGHPVTARAGLVRTHRRDQRPKPCRCRLMASVYPNRMLGFRLIPASRECRSKPLSVSETSQRQRAEKLLMNVFPYSVLKEFKEFGTTTPSFYDEVSVMFLDFVGFTRMPVSKQPKQLILELNEIFSTFDQITEHHYCERIKTIGDAYLAVSGMLDPNPDHALD